MTAAAAALTIPRDQTDFERSRLDFWSNSTLFFFFFWFVLSSTSTGYVSFHSGCVLDRLSLTGLSVFIISIVCSVGDRHNVWVRQQFAEQKREKEERIR